MQIIELCYLSKTVRCQSKQSFIKNRGSSIYASNLSYLYSIITIILKPEFAFITNSKRPCMIIRQKELRLDFGTYSACFGILHRLQGLWSELLKGREVPPVKSKPEEKGEKEQSTAAFE